MPFELNEAVAGPVELFGPIEVHNIYSQYNELTTFFSY
jgi:hypothetical protein